MVNVSQRTTRRNGVTFVHVLVENASSERRRVRLTLACEGPPWPPRRNGVPAAGWEDDGVTVTVAAGNVRGVGFATPTPVADDAVAARPVPRGDDGGTERTGGGDDEPSADGVVRALGAFAPPLAATPREDPPANGDASPRGDASASGERFAAGGEGS